jgi:epsilon-lactone hydrolase
MMPPIGKTFLERLNRMSQQQLQQIIQMLKAQPIAQPTMQEMRANFEQMAGLFPVAADVKCEPVNAGGVKSEWVTAPGADASRAILYLHGGGYVIGSINTHRALAARLSTAAKARVLVIDYRLAPEHPFPAAVEDSVAAYRWMLAQGLKPSRIAVAGDSAGGGLTVATLVAIREAKLALPGAGVCLSPWIDLEGLGDSMKTKAAADPMVQKDALLEMAKHYLKGQNPRSPLAAPLYADLAGLPPLLIQVGTSETLLDDSTRLAERARKAGVRVTLEPWEHMIHVFQVFAPMLDEGQQAIEKIGEFVRANAA